MPENNIIAAIATGFTSIFVGAGTIIVTMTKISSHGKEIAAIKKDVIFEDRFIEYQKAQTTEHGRINETQKEQNKKLEKQNDLLIEILGKLP